MAEIMQATSGGTTSGLSFSLTLLLRGSGRFLEDGTSFEGRFFLSSLVGTSVGFAPPRVAFSLSGLLSPGGFRWSGL